MITEKQKVLGTSIYNNYYEVLIPSGETHIALSIYKAEYEAPVIIFLPGTMTHPLFYDEFLNRLASNGFNIVGIHFISHGKSPRDKQIFTIQDMIQNTQDTISYVLNTFNQNPILLGTSQGGILSLMVAAEDHRLHAVFAHDALLTSLKESILITRFPEWLQNFDNLLKYILKVSGKMIPALPVHINFYLDINRVFRNETIKHQFLNDPIGRLSYPLAFLASLMTTDTSGLTNGSIRCPVILIASRADPLFPFEYCMKVYHHITAPQKEMMVFDEPNHLLFNECIGKVNLPLIEKLKEYSD